MIVKILSHLGYRPAPAACPGSSSRFIPDNLATDNRLPTQTDGTARSSKNASVIISLSYDGLLQKNIGHMSRLVIKKKERVNKPRKVKKVKRRLP